MESMIVFVLRFGSIIVMKLFSIVLILFTRYRKLVFRISATIANFGIQMYHETEFIGTTFTSILNWWREGIRPAETTTGIIVKATCTTENNYDKIEVQFISFCLGTIESQWRRLSSHPPLPLYIENGTSTIEDHNWNIIKWEHFGTEIRKEGCWVLETISSVSWEGRQGNRK